MRHRCRCDEDVTVPLLPPASRFGAGSVLVVAVMAKRLADPLLRCDVPTRVGARGGQLILHVMAARNSRRKRTAKVANTSVRRRTVHSVERVIVAVATGACP